MLKAVFHIIRKEMLLEFRERYSFLSSLLYLVAITFVVFKVFGSLSGPTRIGLFWVVYLFTAINIVSSSFSNQSMRRKLTYYQLYDAVDLFLAKIVYNLTKLLIAGGVLVFLQVLFGGEQLAGPGLFTKALVLSAVGLTIILSLISAISSYSDNQNALVAILSLPLVIPILLLAMRICLISERFFSDSAVDQYLMMLGGIDLLLLSLSLIFIPLIWKS